MKLSELIARLAEMLEMHGDIPVFTEQDAGIGAARSVYLDSEGKAVIIE